MAFSKIILNNTTQMDLTDTTAVASDVASGKYFYGADGVKTVGTASGGSDIPTFTMTFDENGEEVISITCDKTFAECLAIHESYDGSESPVNVIMIDGGTQFRAMASGYYGDYGILRYVLVPQLYADIIYNRNNGITYSSPSQYPADVRIIKNGTYNPESLELYKPIWGIDVNVPNSFTASDEGKVVSGGALVSQTSLSVTANGTYTTTTNNSVVVNVSGGGGGASNFVHGEFHTNSTYGQQVLTIPYTGTGYVIMATVVVKGGAYVADTTWYTTISRYAVGIWSMTKSNMSVAPTQETYAVVQSIYKNSTSSATNYARNFAMEQNTFQNNASASANGCVVFQNSTTMSVYVQNTSYGLMKDIDYEYFIVYSS